MPVYVHNPHKTLLIYTLVAFMMMGAGTAFAQSTAESHAQKINDINAVVTEVANETSPPDVSELEKAEIVPIEDPPETKMLDSEDNENSPTIDGPSAITESDIGGDAFYDTESIAPRDTKKRPPTEINPDTQPASKFVVVEKAVPANDRSAQLTAAERAMTLGRYESALLILDRLYQENKRDSQVLMNRAVTLQKLERYDEAMEAYEELSKIEPKNIDVSINKLGLLATRYPSIALRRLMDLSKENPDNIGLIGQIAVTSANLGDFDTALRYLGMAMGMQPQNASHVFNAAIILDRAGKKKEAITYYEKALEIDTIHGAGRSIPRESIYERLAHLR